MTQRRVLPILERYGIWIILAAALLIRVWGMDFGLPHLAVVDEGSDIAASLRLAQRQLPSGYAFHRVLLPVVELPFFAAYYVGLRVVGIVDSVDGFRDLYFRDRTGFTLIARSISVVSGAAGVWLVYVLGRLAGGLWAGLLAGGLLAVNFLHSYYSHVALPDVMAVTFSLAAVWCATVLARSHRSIAYIGMGVTTSLALLAKVHVVFFLVPAVAVGLLSAGRSYGWGLTGRGAAKSLLAGAIALPVFNPLIVLRPAAVWADVQDLAGRIYLGRAGGSAPPWVPNLQVLLADVGLPLLVLATVGLVVVLGRPTGERLAIALSFVGFLVAIARTRSLSPNYWLPLTPLAVVLAALAVSRLGGHERAVWRARGAGMLSLLLLAWEVAPTVWTDVLLSRTDTREQAAEYVWTHILADDAVLMGDPFVYSVPLRRNEASIRRLAQISGEILATYQWWLDLPPESRPGPAYDIYGPEYSVSGTTVVEFAAKRQIGYVIQTDYCMGEAASLSVFGAPHITSVEVSGLHLLEAWSPFRGSQACVRPIGGRMSFDYRKLDEVERPGPIVRLYCVAGVAPDCSD